MSEVKNDNLIYGRDDKLPGMTALLLGLQHVFTMSSMLVLPVIVAREIGGGLAVVQGLICLSMIAAGTGTILQSLKKGPVGSGYLCPNLCGPSYLSVSIQAAWIGGLPLMHGMTLLAGSFECIFSRVVHKLRNVFPTEITGLVVLMVGIELIPIGASKFVGIEYAGDSFNTNKILIACITLGTMTGINIWSTGKLKLYCLLIGIVVGFIASVLFGVLTIEDYSVLKQSRWFALPGSTSGFLNLKFDPALALPFLIVSLCASLKTFGNITTCQKINDPEWKKPDMKNIGKGLLADGIAVGFGGLIGGVAVDTSASNVGLSAATSATSRYIGFVAGGLFILLGFFPKLAAVFFIMPDPMMGAIVIFVTCFMVISGIQILLTSKMDTRKTFIIGISMVFGLSAIILPDLYYDIPSWLAPIFSSSLTLSTVLAIILNQVFNLGTKDS